MHLKSIFCMCIFILGELSAAPIKVPTERYAGGADKRHHQGHYPFISYLTFRNICDLSIDDATEWFDPDNVKEGDIIYLNIWYLDWFVNHIHDQINCRYILVSGDVGAWYPCLEFKKLLYDPKLTAWFCRNMVFSYHPKLFQIPTGQDLAQFVIEAPKLTFSLLEAVLNAPYEKQYLLYMCHYPREHGGRDKLVKQFEHQPYVFSRNHSDIPFKDIPRKDFYREMALSKFVLSPIGLETDSVRTWEAIVLGTIPIVEHTFLDPSYDNLPVLMVHDWSEINPGFLEQKYRELKDRSHEEAYFDYWFRLVKNHQKKIYNHDISHADLEATLFTHHDYEAFYTVLRQNAVEHRPIFYKGLLTSLRPFQIAKESSEIYLFDPYLDQPTYSNLNRYVKDQSILENKHKVQLITQEDTFFDLARADGPCTVFLDLTYYRTSLFVNFGICVIDYGNFRQSLKQDLGRLYHSLNNGSLIFGNMESNSYVKEILKMFAKENNLTVEIRGVYWFLLKK